MTSSTSPVNALSVDVEEYFQVSAFEPIIKTDDWDRWPGRVEYSTGQLLDMFGEYGVKVTFFTLGWVAERYPGLLRRMIAEGHEVGCHGYSHVRITEQSPDAFRDDLARSKAVLEETTGVAVKGYRAASFSISRANLWAFNEIEAAGFAYSSSIYPVRHDLYGIPDAPRFPFRPASDSNLIEIPVSTVSIGKSNIPAGGGGYFRLLPYAFSRGLIRRINRGEGASANMYFHPWEFDPEQPRPERLPLKTRFRHYLNQTRTLGRMRRLLNDFPWAPFATVYMSEISGEKHVPSMGELDARI